MGITKLCARRAGRLMRNVPSSTRTFHESSVVAARQNNPYESNHSLVPQEEDIRKNAKNPWTAVKDPNGSSSVYYWNKDTNETTALGAPKPQHWVEVSDPNGSSRTYWWNPDTDETTALGAPKPTQIAALQTLQGNQMQVPQNNNFQYQQLPPQSLGSSMKTYFALGVGMSLAFALISAIL